jgi:hypothetical protein
MEWCLTSPEITSKKVFLWKFRNIYISRLPMTLEKPKTQKTEACAKIGNDVLQKVWQKFEYWFDNSRVTHGDYNRIYCFFGTLYELNFHVTSVTSDYQSKLRKIPEDRRSFV